MLGLMLIHGWAPTVKDFIPTVALVGILILIALSMYRLVWQERAGGELEFGHLIVVTLGIVSVLIVFLITMLFTADLFNEPAEVLAILTALFGVIGTLVGTYFGIKASSDATLTAQKQTETAQQQVQDLARGATSLTIVSVTPRSNDSGVSPTTLVSATFSHDMNPESIQGTNHFTLVPVNPDSEGATYIPVPGAVEYGPPGYPFRVAAFVPKDDLEGNCTYQATITKDVRDSTGKALAADYTWRFKTHP
jgi:hypothetical protein